MQDAFAYCAELVRTADRDRFIASLFAPAERRGALHALYAFNVEIARVREVAREALARRNPPAMVERRGQSRARRGGERQSGCRGSARHDRALSSSPRSLLDLIEARRFDLYDDPMGTLDDLEAYLRQTSSSVFSLAMLILAGAEFEAVAEPAGIASGLTQILRAFPAHVARHQLYVPTEILERHQVRLHDVFAGRSSPGLVAAFAELRDIARRHLTTAGQELKALPLEAVPALLPLAVVRPGSTAWSAAIRLRRPNLRPGGGNG